MPIAIPIVGTSSTSRVVARTPRFENATMRVLLSDWQLAPLVRWQSGNWTSVTTGVDNAFTGLGGQRAVQVLDDPYAARTPDNYLNRNAFTSPDPVPTAR